MGDATPKTVNLGQAALSARYSHAGFDNGQLTQRPAEAQRRAMMLNENLGGTTHVGNAIERTLLCLHPLRVDSEEYFDLVIKVPIEGLRCISGPHSDAIGICGVEANLLKFETGGFDECSPRCVRVAATLL
jgi:hypothetical protein